jgi:hypothetical protein
MRIVDLPRRKRLAVQKIIASMSIEERKAWDTMASEDEEMLLLCLTTEHAHGGVFDLDGIKRHFRVARLLHEAAR